MTWCIHVAKWAGLGQNELKIGVIGPFEHPKWSCMLFRKTHFSPIFDVFYITKWPLFNNFWEPNGAKMAQNGLQMGTFHLLVHPKWPMITFGKTRF